MKCANMLEIGPHRPADLPVIERFIAALHNAERELDSFLSPGDELAADGLKRMLSDIADGKGLVLMARMDEIAVGFGCVLIDDYHEPAYIEAVRRRAYMCYLYVADEWRRKGIGRRLLDVMEAEAKRAGCARLVTRYKAMNVAAGRCYEAAGFTPDQHIVSKPIGR
jgi:GNAT superfamily N-acetyltransferase